MHLELGQAVPLRVQIKDANPSLKVVAVIFDAFGVRLAEVELSHADAGLYFSNMFPMPDTPNITAQFVVEGVDKFGEPYGRGSETFYLKPKVVATEKTFVGELTERTKLSHILVGTVKNET